MPYKLTARQDCGRCWNKGDTFTAYESNGYVTIRCNDPFADVHYLLADKGGKRRNLRSLNDVHHVVGFDVREE